MTSIGSSRSVLASVTVPGSVWIVDLDGVIWITGEPIGDAADAVARLTRAGITVVYATNNSAFTTQTLLDRLARIGISAEPEQLATSADATASLLQPEDTVFVLAEGGVLESLSNRGVEVGGSGPFDAAVVGWTHSFDFDSLSAAATRCPGQRATDRHQ